MIYADPPWWYSPRNITDRMRGGARRHYPLMRDEELLDLAHLVDQLAAPDCFLAMWYTGPRAKFAIQLCEAWGFRFATAFGFVWLKTDKRGRPLGTIGSYTAPNAEAVLFGVRGSMRPVAKLVPSAYTGPRGAHSEKPPEIRRRIDRMYPTVPRLEMFARTRPAGWDTWGLEADGRTKMPLQVLTLDVQPTLFDQEGGTR